MSRESILLVDDDPGFLEVLGKALRRRDYRVYCAQNLKQAETIARDSPLDYAVIDLKIGNESGLDCLPLLLTHHADIRMLILTGYSSISTAVNAIKAGAVDYACKPLDVDEILEYLQGRKNSPVQIAEEPPSVERLQWEHIQRVLVANQGNISATARDLGMHRRTLQRRLHKRPVKR